MEKSHYDGTKVETTQGWYMVKSLITKKQSQFLQRSTLTLYINHMLLVEGERSTTIPKSGYRL